MRTLLLFFLLSMTLSCAVEPVPIEYGQDQCSACKMIIADSRFGAELVTTKGKVYKFDAIECLIPEVIKNGTNHYEYILVTDYYDPGNLISVNSSAFLISPQVPSPMGGNLSAYASQELALNNRGDGQGEVFNWEGLLENLLNVERYSIQ